MNRTLISGLLLAACLVLFVSLVSSQDQDDYARTFEPREQQQQNRTLVGGLRQSAASLFDRIRGSNSTTTTTTTSSPADEAADDAEDEDEDDVEETEEERIISANQTTTNAISSLGRSSSQKRDLGLLTLKAILLGPLIGLTIGKALLRGLIWAVVAYALHLFFPGVLSLLGLGTGLVGFARNMRPDYAQMIVHTLINLHDEFHRLPPVPLNSAAGQQLVHRHY